MSQANQTKTGLLNFLCLSQNLEAVDIPHPTYHHFLGSGSSDSNLDHLLHSREAFSPERLVDIYCKLQHPLVDSHHDFIVSVSTIATVVESPVDKSDNIVAPSHSPKCAGQTI